MNTPTPASERKNNWGTHEGKLAIYRGVMRYLAEHPDERDLCVRSEEHARQIVEKYGNTDIPADAKVVFLPEGDNLRHSEDAQPGSARLRSGMQYEPGASLIITLADQSLGADSDEILGYACSYNIWAPNDPRPS
jgi:hypothetical protein